MCSTTCIDNSERWRTVQPSAHSLCTSCLFMINDIRTDYEFTLAKFEVCDIMIYLAWQNNSHLLVIVCCLFFSLWLQSWRSITVPELEGWIQQKSLPMAGWFRNSKAELGIYPREDLYPLLNRLYGLLQQEPGSTAATKRKQLLSRLGRLSMPWMRLCSRGGRSQIVVTASNRQVHLSPWRQCLVTGGKWPTVSEQQFFAVSCSSEGFNLYVPGRGQAHGVQLWRVGELTATRLNPKRSGWKVSTLEQFWCSSLCCAIYSLLEKQGWNLTTEKRIYINPEETQSRIRCRALSWKQKMVGIYDPPQQLQRLQCERVCVCGGGAHLAPVQQAVIYQWAGCAPITAF